MLLSNIVKKNFILEGVTVIFRDGIWSYWCGKKTTIMAANELRSFVYRPYRDIQCGSDEMILVLRRRAVPVLFSC